VIAMYIMGNYLPVFFRWLRITSKQREIEYENDVCIYYLRRGFI